MTQKLNYFLSIKYHILIKIIKIKKQMDQTYLRMYFLLTQWFNFGFEKIYKNQTFIWKCRVGFKH